MFRWEGAKELCEAQTVLAELGGPCPNEAGGRGPPPAPDHSTGGLQEREGRMAAPYPKKFPSFTWPDVP